MNYTNGFGTGFVCEKDSRICKNWGLFLKVIRQSAQFIGKGKGQHLLPRPTGVHQLLHNGKPQTGSSVWAG